MPLHRVQHLPLRPALEHLGDKAAAIGQHAEREIQRHLGQRHDANVIGRAMPGGVRRHVGQNQIDAAAKQAREPVRHCRIGEIALQQRGTRHRIDGQQIDPDHARGAALDRNLRPAARRRAEIEHRHARADQAEAVIQFDQLEGRARTPAL